ncbi:hypothetical protein [Puniceibacterium sp. IMCC21224]|uniref:hypothetical protein n=1 Tax=Puniceibacterium sp. IMCC21224 TaxID=1618204 RepID=UPI00064D943A|nr:hypothetical protein [Puniceibacterium sp. IMCC21224]KMK66130.1 hypothetical protein IMCC21224_11977 [Puniceibacterium sp. IMCC21224]
MQRQPPQRVEDFTSPALVMGLVNLLWVFFVLWALYGLGAVLLAGAALNHLIQRLAARRTRNN